MKMAISGLTRDRTSGVIRLIFERQVSDMVFQAYRNENFCHSPVAA